jgi:hypothetical protein
VKGPENCLLYVLKYNFVEMDEAMFHVVERPYEIIFSNLSIEKSDFDEVA